MEIENCLNQCRGMFALGLLVSLGVFYLVHLLDIVIQERRETK